LGINLKSDSAQLLDSDRLSKSILFQTLPCEYFFQRKSINESDQQNMDPGKSKRKLSKFQTVSKLLSSSWTEEKLFNVAPSSSIADRVQSHAYAKGKLIKAMDSLYGPVPTTMDVWASRTDPPPADSYEEAWLHEVLSNRLFPPWTKGIHVTEPSHDSNLESYVEEGNPEAHLYPNHEHEGEYYYEEEYAGTEDHYEYNEHEGEYYEASEEHQSQPPLGPGDAPNGHFEHEQGQ
jgi:hypothetical protein